ncbi:MAG TPA: hypothetical protein VFW45_11670 [Candidatus Polarisedimenticolia bacterium]|nr:hypothetical protein [Candidatus Polarisedimenticolia bacterium]
MELRIVNPKQRYSRARLIEPSTSGFIYLAASVHPRTLFPIVLPSVERSKLLAKLGDLSLGVQQLDQVIRVHVFRAIFMPPTVRFSAYLKQRKGSFHIADFDVMVLIETTSVAAAREVQKAPEYVLLLEAMRKQTRAMHVMATRNVRRIGGVDTTRQGLFLFNHFAADDPAVMLDLWEYLADWYAKETGLSNSVVLAPLEGESSDYAIVNWARWDESPPAHFWHQLSKKTFWNYVTPNLDANHAASMPIYCRLVGPGLFLVRVPGPEQVRAGASP